MRSRKICVCVVKISLEERNFTEKFFLFLSVNTFFRPYSFHDCSFKCIYFVFEPVLVW